MSPEWWVCCVSPPKILQVFIPPDVCVAPDSPFPIFPPHCWGLKGLDVCNCLFNVVPVFFTTFILWPLLEISFWYVRFSFPSGVDDGTNRTESKAPSLYQVRFFCPFNLSRSSRFHCLGLLIGRIPKPCFFSIVWNAFFTAHMPLYRNDCVYSEYCIFLINLMTCAHTTSHGRCPLQWCAAFLV